jgi:hypothetical protein
VTRLPNLAIIGGCGSSGTTLLANLLNQHPAVISGPELNFFNHHEILDISLLQTAKKKLLLNRCPVEGYHELSGFLRYRSYFGINPSQFEDWVMNSETSVDLIKKLRNHILTHSGKSYFIEKTPTNVYNFMGLSKLDPVINLIHVVRDGRDVTVSLMKRGWSLFRAGSRWLYDTLSGLTARGSNGYLEIRYEELVREPFSILQVIFEHLSLPFDKETYDMMISRPRGDWWENNQSTKGWRQTPHDPISTASIGSYQVHLNTNMLCLLNRIRLTECSTSKIMSPVQSFQEVLNFLGYERSNSISRSTLNIDEKMTARLFEIRDYFRRTPKSLRKSKRLPWIFTHIAND